MLVKGGPGVHPNNGISKFTVLWFKMCSTDHNKFCTHHDSKISLWSAKYVINKEYYKVSSNFEFDQNTRIARWTPDLTKIHTAACTHRQLQGGGHQANICHFVIFPVFQNHQNISDWLNIMFIFDRCRHSSAALAPVKYECRVPTPLGRPKIRTFPGPFQDLGQIYKDLQLTYDS